MLSTPLICASIGDATESARVLESAPGYVADTVTCTGVIVGYCWTGSTFIATRPARQMMMETTAANTGRSMKNRENMPGDSRLLAGRDFHAAGVAVAAGARHLLRFLEANALRGNAFGNQRIAHGRRAPLRKRYVRTVVARAIGEARHVDGIGARLHWRHESLQQPDRLGVERPLAGCEVDDQRRP